MAYLTNFNFKKLCRKVAVNVEVSLEFFVEQIYNDKNIYFILTKREIERLFIFKMMLLNEQTFKIDYYKEVPERKDSQTLVLEKGGKIKYHLNANCSLLKKDYLDFFIPEEIRKFGLEGVEEYRSWFVENNFVERYKNGLIDKNTIIAAFNLKYPHKYGIKPITSDSNLLVIKRLNSSNKAIEKAFDVEEFKRKLQDLKNQWSNAFTCKVHRTLAKQRYLLDRDGDEIKQRMTVLFSDRFSDNFGMNNIKAKLTISRDITSEILELLEEYIKWSYSLDVESKDFNVLTLEQFGLTCCNLCAENKRLI